MIKKVSRNEMRLERHKRIRKTLSGTAERPRLNVFRSNANITAQIIDDEKQITLVSASTFENGSKFENGSNVEAAKQVGATVAKRALEAGVTEVVFDRGGFLFHGRVKALAEAAREGGLEF